MTASRKGKWKWTLAELACFCGVAVAFPGHLSFWRLFLLCTTIAVFGVIENERGRRGH